MTTKLNVKAGWDGVLVTSRCSSCGVRDSDGNMGLQFQYLFDGLMLATQNWRFSPGRRTSRSPQRFVARQGSMPTDVIHRAYFGS